MIRYEVTRLSEEKNYGIKDYFIKYSDKKVLGVIGEKKNIFEYDIGTHWARINDYINELRSFNLYYVPWVGGKVNKLDIAYTTQCFDVELPPKNINSFQYECVMGLISECQECATNEKPISITITGRLFNSMQQRLVIYPFKEELVSESDRKFYKVEDINQVLEELELLHQNVLKRENENPFEKFIGKSTKRN